MINSGIILSKDVSRNSPLIPDLVDGLKTNFIVRPVMMSAISFLRPPDDSPELPFSKLLHCSRYSLRIVCVD